jgi:hypothetical protein
MPAVAVYDGCRQHTQRMIRVESNQMLVRRGIAGNLEYNSEVRSGTPQAKRGR